MPNRPPEPGEHAPHHAHYISLVTGSVLRRLEEQVQEVDNALSGVGEETAGYRYAAGKWSVREVIGHLADAERVYQYRALCFARGDSATLPQFDPDGYVASAGFDARPLAGLIAEWQAVRAATLAFFANLPAEAWSRGGTMGGNPLTVRALAYIAAGHVAQHLNVLRERYLAKEALGGE
jgi:hypothetical protein